MIIYVPINDIMIEEKREADRLARVE